MANSYNVKKISKSGNEYKEFAIVRSCFVDKFGYEPTFCVRAPGRVNLIGEHIDYCGYSVLPMAIQQDITIAAALNDVKKLNLTNYNSGAYSDFSTCVDDLKIDQENPKWYHYFLCGFRGMVEFHHLVSPMGMDIAIHGTVPPSSGLSSSSALVCSSSLATLFANNIEVQAMELATLCAKSERYIGTEGGGMDQAIAILAEPGCAKLIDFNPLQTRNVPLPPGATFVVANSCVEANKAASSHYNVRVVECRLAAQLIALAHNLEWKKFRILADVQKALGIPSSDMTTVVDKVLHKDPYRREELCQILSMTDDDFCHSALNSNTKDLCEFKLYQRALHVYQEASRVLQFKAACEKQSEETLLELGRLMNASHVSCRDLYECSHPDLDELVQVALNAGAFGSRLTGAGWGGCSVSLVPSNVVNSFLDEVREKFYKKTQKRVQMMNSSLFPTLPGGGAVVYNVV